jgi:hypothetical protein
MPEQTYAARIRHPGEALDPPKNSGSFGVGWWWIIGVGLAAFVFVAVFRPQWLARFGVHVNLSDAAKAVGGAVSNPMGWVG